MNKKKYYVCLPFSGSLEVEVYANSEDEALALGRREIEHLSDDEVMNSIEWENYDVYKA